MAIALSGVFLLIGCFGADFIQFDDDLHTNSPYWGKRTTDWVFFIPNKEMTYIPLALISYNADRWLHNWWVEKAYGTWAPAVRLDNLLIHAMAALVLWRLMVRLRISETSSFLIAMLFACHPTACESVCWVPERKNVLAALFGFAALSVQAEVFRPPFEATKPVGAVSRWRWPLTCLLYTMSLMSKPSTLGLLPIVILLECAYLFPPLGTRLFGVTAYSENMPRRVPSVVGLVAMLVISAACLWVNIMGGTAIPPGGTPFTAVLTDLEIFSRYLFNLVCPIGLSAMYFIDPILGLSDSRVWLYGAALFGIIGGTIYFSRNRWIAAFGWFWFFSALGANSNVIAIPHWMQDRYIYLSAPGFWLAICECAAGLSVRFMSEQAVRRSLAFTVIAIVSVACMAMSASRSYVWQSMLTLSMDGAQKQPKAFFAHYGFGWSINPRWYKAPPGSPEYEAKLRIWRNEFAIAIECPDAERYSFKQWAATELGRDAYMFGDAAKAEHYFKIGVTKPALGDDFVDAHVISLAYLSLLDVYFKRDPNVALEKAKESLKLYSSDYGHYAMGNALIACAQKDPQRKEALFAEARKTFAEIPPTSGMRADADALLASMK